MQQDLDIIYQDDFFVAINKPSGLIVHPGQGGNYLEPSVLKLLKKQINKWIYPIHRLDRPTSGVLILGIDKDASSQLMMNWDQTEKFYYALICGDYNQPGEFTFALKEEDKINRDTGEKYSIFKDAHTIYQPIKQYQGQHCKLSLVDVQIKTGRRHQIRRHFARCVTPVAGDTKYGKAKFNNDLRENFNIHRLFLHCHTLKFCHPITSQIINLQAPMPNDLNITVSPL